MRTLIALLVQLSFLQLSVFADGKVMPQRNDKGSLEEKAQEAIIMFTPGSDGKGAVEDLIIKIQVAGKVDAFRRKLEELTKKHSVDLGSR